MLELGLSLFFPFLMIYAASSDLFSMTIPNRVSLALIIGFFPFAFFLGLGMSEIYWHMIAFGVILLGGFSLFALGVMGGGDVKLAASTSLWLGWSHFFEYLLITSILGAVLTLAFVFLRGRYVPEPIGRVGWVNRLYNEDKIPYGIALGAAALVIYPDTVWMDAVIR